MSDTTCPAEKTSFKYVFNLVLIYSPNSKYQLHTEKSKVTGSIPVTSRQKSYHYLPHIKGIIY